jgi:hypothetical protein
MSNGEISEAVLSDVQVANTWPKITACNVHVLVSNGKGTGKPGLFFSGCNFRKANNLGYCRESDSQCGGQGFGPLCSTNRINDLGQGGDPALFIRHRVTSLQLHHPGMRPKATLPFALSNRFRSIVGVGQALTWLNKISWVLSLGRSWTRNSE